MGGPLRTKTEFYNVELGHASGPVYPVQVAPNGFLVPYLDSETLLPAGA